MAVLGRIIACLHFGNNFMPETFPTVPKVGEAVDVPGCGELTVDRVEHDADGRVHLYLGHSGSVDGLV